MSLPAQQRAPVLVPARLRVLAIIAASLCALTVAILGAVLAGGTQPTSLDRTVASLVQQRSIHFGRGLFGLAGFSGPANPGGPIHATELGSVVSPFALLGAPLPITLLTALLCCGCLARRRVRAAVMLASGVILASALTEFALKPLIHRTYEGWLVFPSGHSTVVFALATGIALLLASQDRSRLPSSMRAAAAIVAFVIACGCALGLVADQMHYFTDTIGGAATGIGVMLAVALLLDLAANRRGPPGRYLSVGFRYRNTYAAAPPPARSASK
jgi:undecaprenyl-diphosphatase